MVTLAPLTTFQERWAMKAAVAKFRSAALEDGALSENRMRLIGLDADMQKRVLKEIKTHNTTINGENGRKVEILGLEKVGASGTLSVRTRHSLRGCEGPFSRTISGR